MKCRSGKVRYRNHLDAKIALSFTTRKRKTAYQEIRAYRCPECKGWHLTSRAER